MLPVLHRCASVSYTHLDVYKRQEESDAIADIEEKLDVKIPEFYYRPYGMEYMRYEIETEPDVALSLIHI